MSTIERLEPDRVADPDPEPAYLSLDEAGPMVDALRSRTARSIVVELSREPAAATTIADRTGTSLQNVGYHLSNLEDAGIVTVVGTRYSEKGREMDVYARAVTSLVIGGSTVADDDGAGQSGSRSDGA
jgi:DNA-binding transcriptional ArsR family regulator